MTRWTIGTGGIAIGFEAIYSSLSVKLYYYYIIISKPTNTH